MNLKNILILMLCLLTLASTAQPGSKDKIRVEKGQMIFTIDLNKDTDDIMETLDQFALDSAFLEAFNNLKSTFKVEDFTYTIKYKNGTAEIIKSLSENIIDVDWVYLLHDADESKSGYNYIPQPVIGINDLKKLSVIEKDGWVTFKLLRNFSASSVYLSGTFNDWSTLKTPMQHTDEGWEVSLKLLPGKHLYKFIVDGEWTEDKSNNLKEPDGAGGYNSIWYVSNHTFRLNAYTNARKVVLTGSFNNWHERALKMLPTSEGWELPLYLKDGEYLYKFIVDGEWMTDPENPVVRNDGWGNENSVLGIGDQYRFILKGFENAEKVYLAGSFNSWNDHDIIMKSENGIWSASVYLAPGVYEYKFIVDGTWMPDPDNTLNTGEEEFINSLLIFKPNYTFSLAGYSNAESVILTGSFNNWHEDLYHMYRKDGLWEFSLFLNPGKYLYKFIIDGEWILDPGNELWEENEFGTGNSVLWFKQTE